METFQTIWKFSRQSSDLSFKGLVAWEEKEDGLPDRNNDGFDWRWSSPMLIMTIQHVGKADGCLILGSGLPARNAAEMDWCKTWEEPYSPTCQVNNWTNIFLQNFCGWNFFLLFYIIMFIWIQSKVSFCCACTASHRRALRKPCRTQNTRGRAPEHRWKKKVKVFQIIMFLPRCVSSCEW